MTRAPTWKIASTLAASCSYLPASSPSSSLARSPAQASTRVARSSRVLCGHRPLAALCSRRLRASSSLLARTTQKMRASVRSSRASRRKPPTNPVAPVRSTASQREGGSLCRGPAPSTSCCHRARSASAPPPLARRASRRSFSSCRLLSRLSTNQPSAPRGAGDTPAPT